MSKIIIITDSNVTESQKQKAQDLVGANLAVQVLPLSAMQVTEGRHLNPAFNSNGEIIDIQGYTFSAQIQTGEKNSDGTNRSARGHFSLGKSETPTALKEYAHYLEGMDVSTRIVNPNHVFENVRTESGNRLSCKAGNRSWYSMKPLGGVFIFEIGASEALTGELAGRYRTPIKQLVIAKSGEFGKTISEREVAPAVVLNGGWDEESDVSENSVLVADF